MNDLVSGMMLIVEGSGDLHTLVSTPYGFKVVEASGDIVDFNKENYEKAYIPKDYNDPWEPLENTIIKL